ncbi:hypothetical protein [uncultured Maribacter sp.]|uniref:tetratricopeptide repeat protein n=1 Tax=uncultured Maribacter sp. TaxID=431308 RepID=UPI0030EED394|tara:strand:+ start:23492 stop:24229 length:738 start_codon:yes stop_codon:yes gene_type:complete
MMDKEKLVLKYFDGTLTKDEQIVFNQFLESDANFKAQFELEKDVQAVIRENERVELKRKLQGFESELGTKVTLAKRTFWKPFQIAASIILLLGASWFVFNSDIFNGPEELYATSYEKYPNTVYTITRGDTADTSLERLAFEAYETNDYEAAIKYLKELKDKTGLDYVDFYLGQSYLGNGETLKAINEFEKTISINGEYKQEAFWYAALAHLKLDHKNKAKDLLIELIENETYKLDEATELLEKLK